MTKEWKEEKRGTPGGRGLFYPDDDTKPTLLFLTGTGTMTRRMPWQARVQKTRP